MRPIRIGALALCFAACGLDPQPLPPGQASVARDAGPLPHEAGGASGGAADANAESPPVVPDNRVDGGNAVGGFGCADAATEGGADAACVPDDAGDGGGDAWSDSAAPFDDAGSQPG